MSLINDITAVVGNRSPYGANGQQPTFGTGQQPGGPSAASQVANRFGGVFGTTFTGTLATVVERGKAGEFDDRSIALEEQAALTRLRIAQQAAAVKPVETGGVPTNATPGGIGGETPVTGGGETGTPGGASAAPDANSIAVSETREVYAVKVRASEARLRNVTETLTRDYPLAAKLAPSSTGSWDPETFVPQTREQAEAFAHRMTIDVAQSAARLEIVMAELDAAKFELSQGGGPDVQQRVVELEAAFTRQQAYVAKLGRIVDQNSSGQLTDAGVDARAGRTLRGISDMPVGDVVAALQAQGMDEEEITRVVGAMEVVVEQEKTPGGSERLKKISSDMTRTLVADFNRRIDKMREDGRRREETRAEERRLDDKRADKKQTDQQASETKAEQRRAEQDAAWQQWLANLAAQHSQQKAG